MARGYDNHLKWNEVAKLKADLMNARARWLGVPVTEIADRCRTLGMRDEDVTEMTDLVRKAQEVRPDFWGNRRAGGKCEPRSSARRAGRSDRVALAALGVQGSLVRYVVGVAVYHLAGLPAVEAH
jgi:hypothetical protein